MRCTRSLRATLPDPKHIPPAQWKSTLRLPSSTFPPRPSTADLAQYRQRCADDLYAWQTAARPHAAPFVLHDGPPYANGAVHVGHALNKVLKDVLCRFHVQRGRRVVYRPGWDCHGLPIEIKALRLRRTRRAGEHVLGEDVGAGMTAGEVRRAARELATAAVREQKAAFRAWGVMGDWQGAYQTMDREFEIRQLRVFQLMVMKGLVFRQHRPVYWSPSSRTALAEAELEYDDDHRCTAAFVKFPLTRLPKILRENAAVDPKRLSAVVWTTTPWTIPANKAVAVKSDVRYSVIELLDNGKMEGGEQLLIAQARIEHVYPRGAAASRVVADAISGADLADGEGMYHNVFSGESCPLIAADFVTASSGTGLVHLAPGHGMDDYQACLQHGIEATFAPVDDDGRFTELAFPADVQGRVLTGLDVQTDGVDAVLKILEDAGECLRAAGVTWEGASLLLASHEFSHKNPIDWRTKQPVITRATAQWFADVSAIKDRTLEALDNVVFVPAAGKARLSSFVESRSQWCISRQRAWGVPIPALYDRLTGDPLVTPEVIEHVIATINERGSDAWFEDAPDEPAWIHPSLSAGQYVRGKDTMDVWFDSGTTWTSLGHRDNMPPADVYVEGTDQHRGWFQSSLLTYVATSMDKSTAQAPFSTLITHGFTLDEHGRKMSKSLGNVVSPQQIMDGSLLPPLKAKSNRTPSPKKNAAAHDGAKANKPANFDAMGPDALRLWAASSDYTKDVAISVPVLQSIHQALQKYRVTLKFLLGVLHDYPANRPLISDFMLPHMFFADRIVLHQLGKRARAVEAAYGDYRFYRGIVEVNSFVNTDLSAAWFERIKDRLYAGSLAQRRHTQTIACLVLEELCCWLAPVVPHLVEEVWTHLPARMKEGREPLLQRVKADVFDVGIGDVEIRVFERSVGVVKRVGDAVKAAQELARAEGRVGNGLACRVEIRMGRESGVLVRDVLARVEGELSELFVVSQAELVLGTELAGDRESRMALPAPAWSYEVHFDASDPGTTSPSNESAAAVGQAVVLPPLGEKCVRCWQYVAETREAPCARCLAVVQEAVQMGQAQE